MSKGVCGSTWAYWGYKRRRLLKNVGWEWSQYWEPVEDKGGTLGGFLSPQVRRNIVP